jgi:hypothetical protein
MTILVRQELSGSESDAAGLVMNTMFDLQYLNAEEAALLPHGTNASPYIAYGPAATFPAGADLLVGVGHSRQLMVVMEAVDGMPCDARIRLLLDEAKALVIELRS